MKQIFNSQIMRTKKNLKGERVENEHREGAAT